MRDVNGFIVQSEHITFNDSLCPTTGQNFSMNYYYYHCNYICIYYVETTTIASEGPSESDGPSLSGGAIAAITVVLLAAIVLVVAIIVTISLVGLSEISLVSIYFTRFYFPGTHFLELRKSLTFTLSSSS